MRKLFIVCSLVVALVGFMTLNAVADQITGAITFSGTSMRDNPDLLLAIEFIGFSNVVVSTTGGTGDYASVLSGQSVTFTPFQFSPVLSPNPVEPLWTFTIDNNNNNIIYSFDATGLARNPWRASHKIRMWGPGIAHISGFEDTPGIWYISVNRAGGMISFSAAPTEVPEIATLSSTEVPEPATLILLGLGLVGLAGLRRKF